MEWEKPLCPDILKYQNALKDVKVTPIGKQYVEDVWTKYDVDENGHLDMSEGRKYVEQLMRMATGMPDFILDDLTFRAVIKKIDVNSDGNISKQEVYMIIDEWNIQLEDENDDDEEEK